MKAVLVGTDLMYRQDGKLVPIEMNTNVGWDTVNRQEPIEEIFDLRDLKEYLQEHNITKLYVQGTVKKILRSKSEDLKGLDIFTVSSESSIQDENPDTYLYIRSAYSDEALVDAFCRDKVEFLRSIKNEDFGSEFIVRTTDGLEGEITSLEDNGDLPNFIVKCRYPAYDRNEYPKLLRFESLGEMNSWVKNNLEQDCFIMPFYFNEDELYENSRLKLIRNWSLFIANETNTIDSILIGNYTKLSKDLSTVDGLTWKESGEPSEEWNSVLHDTLIIKADSLFMLNRGDVLVEETDLILMSDGTWKEAKYLEVGDLVKAVTVPTSGSVDIRRHTEDYNVSLEQLQEESEYLDNSVSIKIPVEGHLTETFITFTDGTDWVDTEFSAYPTLDAEDQTVRFKNIKDLKQGDKVILIPLSEDFTKPKFIVREVDQVETKQIIQKGYKLGLTGNHLFLSRTSKDQNAYISIEHNEDPVRSRSANGNFVSDTDGTCFDNNTYDESADKSDPCSDDSNYRERTLVVSCSVTTGSSGVPGYFVWELEDSMCDGQNYFGGYHNEMPLSSGENKVYKLKVKEGLCNRENPEIERWVLRIAAVKNKASVESENNPIVGIRENALDIKIKYSNDSEEYGQEALVDGMTEGASCDNRETLESGSHRSAEFPTTLIIEGFIGFEYL